MCLFLSKFGGQLLKVCCTVSVNLNGVRSVVWSGSYRLKYSILKGTFLFSPIIP